MCGIVGTVGVQDAVPFLLQGLQRLEYRGYDSAGIAVIDSTGAVVVRKEAGKLQVLAGALEHSPAAGVIGIGHTRWATHGEPNATNAHPHLDGARRFAVVHNGIIENHGALRAELIAAGHTLVSDTDTEVVAHLIAAAYRAQLGAGALPSGVPGLPSGADGLPSGADGLSSGADALPSGADALPSGADALPSGTGALPGGAHDGPSARDGGATGAIGANSANEPFVAAVRAAAAQLDGSFALVALSADVPDTLVVVRRFSPLVVGVADGAAYVASDIPALVGRVAHVTALDDDQVAILTPGHVRVTDLAGRTQPAPLIEVPYAIQAAEKGGYEHFVRKEIDEQPAALRATLAGRVEDSGVVLRELDGLDVAALRRVCIVAAGSSYYAGLAAKRQLEEWARLPTDVTVASEFRYGAPVLDTATLVLLISQSGETADTLAAQRLAASSGAPTLAVTNVVGSSLARAVDATLYLQVGPEIGVVATKTFTGQLTLLAVLAAYIAGLRHAIAPGECANIARDLLAVPQAVTRALQCDDAVRTVAATIAAAKSVLFIGRGYALPVALEAALKLKEITYMHAEGYPAGELKHGPIALIEHGTPVVAFVPAGPTRAKTLSNLQEVLARGGRVLAVGPAGTDELATLAEWLLPMPPVSEALSPIVHVVPAQLLAYHAAVALGRDVDQPRNLAKSVTVE